VFLDEPELVHLDGQVELARGRVGALIAERGATGDAEPAGAAGVALEVLHPHLVAVKQEPGLEVLDGGVDLAEAKLSLFQQDEAAVLRRRAGPAQDDFRGDRAFGRAQSPQRPRQPLHLLVRRRRRRVRHHAQQVHRLGRQAHLQVPRPVRHDPRQRPGKRQVPRQSQPVVMAVVAVDQVHFEQAQPLLARGQLDAVRIQVAERGARDDQAVHRRGEAHVGRPRRAGRHGVELGHASQRQHGAQHFLQAGVRQAAENGEREVDRVQVHLQAAAGQVIPRPLQPAARPHQRVPLDLVDDQPGQVDPVPLGGCLRLDLESQDARPGLRGRPRGRPRRQRQVGQPAARLHPRARRPGRRRRGQRRGLHVERNRRPGAAQRQLEGTARVRMELLEQLDQILARRGIAVGTQPHQPPRQVQR
jgi:hypothetical protein